MPKEFLCHDLLHKQHFSPWFWESSFWKLYGHHMKDREPILASAELGGFASSSITTQWLDLPECTMHKLGSEYYYSNVTLVIDP